MSAWCWWCHNTIQVTLTPGSGGGRVVQWCWVNFRCRGVLLIWIWVGQGPTALAVGAGGGCLDIFTLVYHFSFLSPAVWETAWYRLKYCLKGPLSPKQPTNQPTNQLFEVNIKWIISLTSYFMQYWYLYTSTSHKRCLLTHHHVSPPTFCIEFLLFLLP